MKRPVELMVAGFFYNKKAVPANGQLFLLENSRLIFYMRPDIGNYKVFFICRELCFGDH
jgi:hypothetical protein